MQESDELEPGTILGRLSLAACDLLDILNAADADGVREALERRDLVPLAEAVGMELAEIEDRLEELRSASLALMCLVRTSFGGSNPPLSVRGVVRLARVWSPP
jgi:hypothetical protein